MCVHHLWQEIARTKPYDRDSGTPAPTTNADVSFVFPCGREQHVDFIELRLADGDTRTIALWDQRVRVQHSASSCSRQKLQEVVVSDIEFGSQYEIRPALVNGPKLTPITRSTEASGLPVVHVFGGQVKKERRGIPSTNAGPVYLLTPLDQPEPVTQIRMLLSQKGVSLKPAVTSVTVYDVNENPRIPAFERAVESPSMCH